MIITNNNDNFERSLVYQSFPNGKLTQIPELLIPLVNINPVFEIHKYGN